jgi:hypothetical protein
MLTQRQRWRDIVTLQDRVFGAWLIKKRLFKRWSLLKGWNHWRIWVRTNWENCYQKVRKLSSRMLILGQIFLSGWRWLLWRTRATISLKEWAEQVIQSLGLLLSIVLLMQTIIQDQEPIRELGKYLNFKLNELDLAHRWRSLKTILNLEEKNQRMVMGVTPITIRLHLEEGNLHHSMRTNLLKAFQKATNLCLKEWANLISKRQAHQPLSIWASQQQDLKTSTNPIQPTLTRITATEKSTCPTDEHQTTTRKTLALLTRKKNTSCLLNQRRMD